MKNSSFDRWTVFRFSLTEHEHSDLAHHPEYLVKLTMKDGSFLEYNLVHTQDYLVLPRISSWMTCRVMCSNYILARHMKLFVNPEVGYCSFFPSYLEYQMARNELIRIGLRFGHRVENI